MSVFHCHEATLHTLPDAFCRRALTDEVSKLILGLVPRNRIPHNQTAANRVLELRRNLLGE
jgi:hypothetical protein